MNSKITSVTVITTVITTYLMLFNYHLLDFLNNIIIFEYTLNQLIFMLLIVAAVGVVTGMIGFNKQSEEQIKSLLKNVSGMSDQEMNRFERDFKNQYKNRLESAVPDLNKLEQLKNLIPNSTTTKATTAVSLAEKSEISNEKIKANFGSKIKPLNYPTPCTFIKYLVSLQNTLVLNPKYVLTTGTNEVQTPLKIIQAIPFSNVIETKKKGWKSKFVIILAAIIIIANVGYLLYTGGLPIAL